MRGNVDLGAVGEYGSDSHERRFGGHLEGAEAGYLHESNQVQRAVSHGRRPGPRNRDVQVQGTFFGGGSGQWQRAGVSGQRRGTGGEHGALARILCKAALGSGQPPISKAER